MGFLRVPKYFIYFVKHYVRNLFAILFGLSFAFAAIDYFQHIQSLDVSGNYKILYIFYMWQEALGLLYPLAIVFALLMTKLSFVKQNTMGVLHAFGYSKKQLVIPLLLVSLLTYGIFQYLNTTEFSYAKDKAKALLHNQINAYNVNNVFFKYNDTFVYMKKLDPVHKRIDDMTIFKVSGHKVLYTLHAAYALFDDTKWNAFNVLLKRHLYDDKGYLNKYAIEQKEHIETLVGYKPKIIESLYEGKALNIIDAYHTWKLLEKQHVNSDKIRSVLYEKTIVPLFAPALLLILFFKLPFHARMARLGWVTLLSLGTTFVVWGILFGLTQIGMNGVLLPEITSIIPIVLLWIYAIYVFVTDERRIR
jgi:lipopolysaccharide export system permease protein